MDTKEILNSQFSPIWLKKKLYVQRPFFWTPNVFVFFSHDRKVFSVVFRCVKNKLVKILAHVQKKNFIFLWTIRKLYISLNNRKNQDRLFFGLLLQLRSNQHFSLNSSDSCWIPFAALSSYPEMHSAAEWIVISFFFKNM